MAWFDGHGSHRREGVSVSVGGAGGSHVEERGRGSERRRRARARGAGGSGEGEGRPGESQRTFTTATELLAAAAVTALRCCRRRRRRRHDQAPQCSLPPLSLAADPAGTRSGGRGSAPSLTLPHLPLTLYPFWISTAP